MICKHCGKPLEMATYSTGVLYYHNGSAYCYGIFDKLTTKQLIKRAEPLTENDILKSIKKCLNK